ncbi:transmembrane protein 255B-like isoform X1 [Acipenser ruthenus]|uniref:transmembrane protein 255B-like isoform X1 n=1 Tax=Acipenser ruthenus TaxID=7906 RepID=UPI00145B3143|nr:transmembrane protein 255B-like isoform X1 [Acipenser ruthenus]
MQQPTAPSTVDALDAAEQFAKRRRTALWFTIALLVLSLIILVLGLAAGTRTGNVDVAGYYPGIILSFGSFLALVGINLVENRRPMLVASIIFISIGVIAAFFCAIVDGVIAAEFIDRRPLSEGRCQFYSSGSGYAYDNYHTEVLCYTFSSKCKLRVKSNTCYCCDLYNCESPERYSKYYEYTGVSSCMDASHLYCLLWASVVLNVLGLFLGIVTAAILGAFKDIKPVTQINCSSAPPPHILYNPAQQVLTYAGFCPSNQALPAYPNYPLPVQHHSSFQVPSSADTPLPDDSQASSQASSSYVLSPNAPSLYTPPYNPGDKPPPYAS